MGVMCSPGRVLEADNRDSQCVRFIPTKLGVVPGGWVRDFKGAFREGW